ncbi:MAG: NusG domain II-containing protein [Lachnospiraceae bacterium]|nr:NusG domain II-containing protein [Lachnospiraceae bacterium]MDY5775655.1 NusG domain II-containing protein [Lachnospiraceae bacterium]
MKKRFGRNDVIFLGILAILLLFIWFFGRNTGAEGSSVQVTIDGKVYGTYSLEENQTIPIEQEGKTTNILQIEDGKAKMISADCPDQLCVHQSSIAKSKETIVCLPNKVVVEVQGSGDKKDYDAVVK